MLPVHRDQLRAQRSVTSMGKLYLFYVSVYVCLYVCLSVCVSVSYSHELC